MSLFVAYVAEKLDSLAAEINEWGGEGDYSVTVRDWETQRPAVFRPSEPAILQRKFGSLKEAASLSEEDSIATAEALLAASLSPQSVQPVSTTNLSVPAFLNAVAKQQAEKGRKDLVFDCRTDYLADRYYFKVRSTRPPRCLVHELAKLAAGQGKAKDYVFDLVVSDRAFRRIHTELSAVSQPVGPSANSGSEIEWTGLKFRLLVVRPPCPPFLVKFAVSPDEYSGIATQRRSLVGAVGQAKDAFGVFADHLTGLK